MGERKIEVGHAWSAEQWDWPLQHQDGVVKLINTKEKFEVGLEVSFFTPKEIEVKVCGDEIIVSCRHDERSDHHGRISREIFRAYKLPPDVDTQTIKSELKSNGMLVIHANKKH